MTTSKAASSTSIAAPAASAISALEGLLRARPSGRSITGSVMSAPAASSSSRPCSDSARQNECGTAQRSKTSRSSYALPDHCSPTMWIVWGTRRRSVAHSSRKPEIAWWKTSSAAAAGLGT